VWYVSPLITCELYTSSFPQRLSSHDLTTITNQTIIIPPIPTHFSIAWSVCLSVCLSSVTFWSSA